MGQGYWQLFWETKTTTNCLSFKKGYETGPSFDIWLANVLDRNLT